MVINISQKSYFGVMFKLFFTITFSTDFDGKNYIQHNT